MRITDKYFPESGRRSATPPQISPGMNTAGTFFLYAAQSSPYLSEQKWSSRGADEQHGEVDRVEVRHDRGEAAGRGTTRPIIQSPV